MSWLDPKFRYAPSHSHDNAATFRRRMQERMRAAEAQAAEAKTKVQPIKRVASK